MYIHPFYPFYIKKEDAYILVKQQKNMAAVVLLAMSITVGCIQFVLFPKLLSTYVDLKLEPPQIAQIPPLMLYGIIVLLMAASYYLYTQEPDYTKLNEQLKKYKPGEMVRTSEVLNTKKDLWVLIPLGFVVGYIVLSVILPIYSLTSAF